MQYMPLCKPDFPPTGTTDANYRDGTLVSGPTTPGLWARSARLELVTAELQREDLGHRRHNRLVVAGLHQLESRRRVLGQPDRRRAES